LLHTIRQEETVQVSFALVCTALLYHQGAASSALFSP
jgi:hypothetical protein